MKRLALLAFALLAGCGAMRDRIDARRANDAAAPVAGGLTEERLTEERLEHDGRNRRFLVHDFSGGKRSSVVIVLHGGGGHAENAAEMTQFDVVARREHFIAVYPDGTGGTPGGRLLTWNAGHCCAYARENKVDDVGFIAKLIDTLVASGRADPKRIYVTGMSNGAMMSHVLARELPDRIAAIGPVVGTLFGDEPRPKGPVAAIILVGQDDSTVPAAGGAIGGNRGDGLLANLARPPADRDVTSDVSQADYWVNANGCAAAPIEGFDRQDRLVDIRWSSCASGKPVEFHRVANNGHAWPGGKAGRAEADQPTKDFNATESLWRFFNAHPKK